MRHDPYSSPWRKVLVALAITTLAAIIVAGVVAVGRRDNSPSTTTANSSTSRATGAPTRPPTPDKSLTDAVYVFTEAYNLPATQHRNELLKKLSTTEGYAMVFRDPATQSSAEKAAGDITVSAVRESSSVQIEPFEDNPSAASVYAEVTVRTIRDGTILQTIRLPGQTTSWVKQADGWKLAFLQP